MKVPLENDVTVKENTEVTFECTTAEGLPAATVRWYKMQETSSNNNDTAIVNNITVTRNNTSDGLVSVKSTLRFSPTKADNGIKIYCAANNSVYIVISARKPLLNVQCE